MSKAQGKFDFSVHHPFKSFAVRHGSGRVRSFGMLCRSDIWNVLY